MLKILIVEGNAKASREKARSEGALTQSDLYEKTLRILADDVETVIVYPADEDCLLPKAEELERYDGIAWTGSALNIYDQVPEVERQITFMQSCLSLPTRAFGSCWGLQVASVAAGGEVALNPKGREIGVARDIQVTEEGRKHPMYKGKPEHFDAVAIHLDHVVKLPGGSTVLSSNAMSAVQAVEIRCGESVFWGVQYHPEFDLAYIATLIRRYSDSLVEEGICGNLAEAAQWAADLTQAQSDEPELALRERYCLGSDVLNQSMRLQELANWLAFLREHQVGKVGQRQSVTAQETRH